MPCTRAFCGYADLSWPEITKYGIDPTIVWKYNFGAIKADDTKDLIKSEKKFMTKTDYDDLFKQCQEICKHTACFQTILPTWRSRYVGGYTNCMMGSIRACIRQTMRVKHPKFKIGGSFKSLKKFYKSLKYYEPNMFKDYLTPDLQHYHDFAIRWLEDNLFSHPEFKSFTVGNVDVIDWFNHLTKKQQDELIGNANKYSGANIQSAEDMTAYIMNRKVNMIKPTNKKTTMAKIEAQDFGVPIDLDTTQAYLTFPNVTKTRCISMPAEASEKLIMGPLIWKLEKLFKRILPGYSSGRSWTEREEMVKTYENLGLDTTIRTDMSAMDAHRNPFKKYLAEIFVILKLLDEDRITYVSREQIKEVGLRVWTQLKCKFLVGKRYQDLGYAEIPGRTFSGENLTTLGNTLTTIIEGAYICEVKLNIPRERYRQDVAGDDADKHVRGDMIDPERVQQAHQELGELLGSVYKKAEIGGLYDSDFCSTHIFKCYNCGPKIIRQLERFLLLTPYSRVASKLTLPELQIYMRDLHTANDMWIGELDIFKHLNAKLLFKLEVDQKLVDKTFKKLNDKINSKMTLSGGLEDIKPESTFNARMLVLDPDYQHKGILRVSPKYKCCNESFRQWLVQKYTWSQQTIDNLIHLIENAQQYEQLDYSLYFPNY